jgi:hypothetical protein
VCGGTMEVFIDVLSPPPNDLDGAVRVGHPA